MLFFLQDTEDSVPLISKLTPEQQKQLELIENMPLVMEHEAKTPEEKERLLGKTLTKLTNKHTLIVGHLFCVNHPKTGLLLT